MPLGTMGIHQERAISHLVSPSELLGALLLVFVGRVLHVPSLNRLSRVNRVPP